MIKSVHIQNFQSHKDTLLRFGPGLNALCGDTDQGKTSVIRAIKWVVKNRPVSGSIYRSTFAKAGEPTKVTIKLDNGTVVKSTLGNKTTYVVRTKDGKLKLTGFGTTLPKEVAELFNLDDLSIQDQFDQPFLTSQSSGAVSRHLNRVANLDIIDRTLFNLQSSHRRNEAEVKRLREEAFETKEQVQQLKPYVAFLKKARNLQKKTERVEVLSARIEELSLITEQIVEIETFIETMPNVDSISERLDILLAKNYEFRVLKKKHSEIKTIVTELEDKIETIKTLNVDIRHRLLKIPNRCPTCGSLLK